MTKPLTLRNLKRCPKCKSADIIQVDGIDSPTEWRCVACDHRFATTEIVYLRDHPEPAEFRPAETLEQNETEPLNITIATKGDVVHLDLGRRVAWFALPKAQACEFAIAILRHCGVDVNIRYKVEGQGGG
jgi:Zn ribbon nucleic-acid-binding protein